MNGRLLFFALILLFLTAPTPAANVFEPLALAQEPAASSENSGGDAQNIEILDRSMFQDDFGKQPTYIKSDSLVLKNQDRIFTYIGSVEVLHGDMTLTCDNLQGSYDKNNQIQALNGSGNVVIIKGDRIRASSQRAIYEAASDLMTLTENPELQQGKSVLSADTVRIYLKEDRSSAEGNVRVKLVKAEDEDESGKGGGKRKAKDKGGHKKK